MFEYHRLEVSGRLCSVKEVRVLFLQCQPKLRMRHGQRLGLCKENAPGRWGKRFVP